MTRQNLSKYLLANLQCGCRAKEECPPKDPDTVSFIQGTPSAKSLPSLQTLQPLGLAPQLYFSTIRKGALNTTKSVLATSSPMLAGGSRIPRKAKHWAWSKSSSLNGKVPTEAGGTTGHCWVLPAPSQASSGQPPRCEKKYTSLCTLTAFCLCLKGSKNYLWLSYFVDKSLKASLSLTDKLCIFSTVQSKDKGSINVGLNYERELDCTRIVIHKNEFSFHLSSTFS